MEINDVLQQNISSLRQAIGISNMKKAMHQDASTVAALLTDMKDATAKILESTITPHKGGNIDIRI